MPTNNDDDYIVSLLLKDAEANKKRYISNSGLGSLLARKPRGDAPKPNTRFLKNIIRETDSHNAALKAKEEEESRARLRGMREGKRKRGEHEDENASRQVDEDKRRKNGDRPGRWASAFGGIAKGPERKQRRGDAEGPGSDESARHRARDYRDGSRERESSRRHRHSRGHGSEESRTRRSRSPTHRKEHKRRDRSRTPPRYHKSAKDQDFDSDDPPETFLGPKPPPEILPRGRGAHKPSATAMDDRFAPGYNPKADVDLSPDEGDGDDWDMALEALRDRAKWRTQGANRLREAGFTEQEVERWEKNAAFPNGGDGGEKDVLDVRWRKEGEGREWDCGKVVGKAGVELKPEWGRLKGE